VILTVGLVACGSPRAQRAEQREEISPLAAAATASQKAGAVRVVMHGTQELEGFDEPSRMSGFGVIDPATERMQFVMEMGETPLGDLGTMEIVGDGLVMYMKSSFFNSLGPMPTPWLKMDLDAIGEKMGFDMSALMEAGGGHDPSQMIDFLHGAADVEEVGRATVHGYETTHYRTVVDLRDAAAAAPPEIRDRVASSVDRLIELSGESSYPMDVWVDDANLVRRMKYVMDYTEVDPSLGMPPMKMTDTTDFMEYGIRARIKPPRPSQVTDLLELIEETEDSAAY
jgi:hypothetical protein